MFSPGEVVHSPHLITIIKQEHILIIIVLIIIVLIIILIIIILVILARARRANPYFGWAE